MRPDARTFQVTLGLWFIIATVNGFFMGVAAAVLMHAVGWWA